MAAPNNGFNPMNNEWNPYHESIQFPPPSVQVLSKSKTNWIPATKYWCEMITL